MANDLLSTPPPLAPPMTQGEMASWLRLIRSKRVGVSTFFRLMQEYGSADAALEALPAIASAAGVQKYRTCPLSLVEAEITSGRQIGAKLLPFGAPDYPAALTEIPDPPPLLWALGDTRLANRPCVALVGARNASSLGTRMAKLLGKGLSEAGFAVVSGLARGIDTAAHLAALENGTIAIQAGGVDVVYPNENRKLHEDIATKGLRLSEQPIGLQPKARDFPRRNRIISGMSRAVVVIEAAAKSGSLITARNALDQGRDILVVPGHPLDGRSTGCNMLIRDGATLVRSTDDILEALSEPVRAQVPVEQPATPAIPKAVDGAIDTKILNLLGPSPTQEDQLIRDLNLPAKEVAPELTVLEMQGKIIRQPGGLLSLAC